MMTSAAIPRVLVAHDDEGVARHWLGAVEGAELASEASLRADEPSVWIVGDSPLRDRLTPAADRVVITLDVGGDRDLFDTVFFVAPPLLPAPDIRALVAAARESLARLPEPAVPDAGEAGRILRALDATYVLASRTDSAAAAVELAWSARRLIACRRAHVRYTAPDGASWCVEPDDDGAYRERDLSDRATGLTGFAARTGQTVVVERAGEDPRLVADDDPGGGRDARLLVQPVVERTGEARASIAVIVLARDGHQRPFDDGDAALLRCFADHAAPLLGRISAGVGATEVLDEARRAGNDLFLDDAVLAHSGGPMRGQPLRVAPPWTAWAPWALLSGTALMFACLFLWMAR